MTDLIKQDWEGFIGELKSILVEREFNSRWEIIVCYHEIGKRITEEKATHLVKRIADDLGRSTRTIQRAVQFYKKYPTLDELQTGKNISWHQIVNKYLPEPTEDGGFQKKTEQAVKRRILEAIREGLKGARLVIPLTSTTSLRFEMSDIVEAIYKIRKKQ